VFSVLFLLVVILVVLNMQLKTARLALGQLNVNLEAQVQERTEKLSIANTKLTAEITERKQVEAQICHMATHDFLTNLPKVK
jgi:C4-dicarboxylate-specific signal transduction histidine kinase